MPVRWVVQHHGPTLERVADGLRDSAGVALIGPAGVGKTELARAAGAQYPNARWVRATAPARAVPFGAFQRHIEVSDVAKTVALLRAARESLEGAGLVVVDDAHHLDKLSATLVYQLASAGSPRLLITVDFGQPTPDPVSALVAEGLLAAVDVEPLDEAATAELLRSVSGDDARAAELHRLSGGNPLHLRHLVAGPSGPSGPGLSTPQPTRDLRASVGRYLMSLPPEVREVLEYLAVEDPLPAADLTALTGPDAVHRAQALGAVRLDGELAQPAHPLYTETIGDHLSAETRRRLCGALVGRLGARPARDVVDRLRLAVLALDSDSSRPAAERIMSAVEALRLGDYELSERLARPALQETGVLSARLALGHALAWQGRGRDAEAVLSDVDPARLSEAELMAWTLPRAANQFWMLGEPTRATAFLLTTRNRVSAPSARATLDALSATFAMNAGTPQRALEMARGVLASPHADGQAIGWAASTAALCCARMGRFDEVDALAARALAAEQPGLLRFTSGLARTTALLMKGQLAQARSLAERYTDFAELQQPGRAIGEVLVAHAAIAQGDFDTAVALLQPAADVLEPTGYSWGSLAVILLAQALGQLGEATGAAKALSHAEARHGMKSALFGPELALARAWARSAARDREGAIGAAREAARAAERGGQSAVALRALHDAVRLGDSGDVDRIIRLAREVECVAARLALAHGLALASGDAAALEAVATQLDDLGMHAAARDAAAEAKRCGGWPLR